MMAVHDVVRVVLGQMARNSVKIPTMVYVCFISSAMATRPFALIPDQALKRGTRQIVTISRSRMRNILHSRAKQAFKVLLRDSAVVLEAMSVCRFDG